MKYYRWFSLIIVGLVLSIGTTGCLVERQVRYASGPPNVAVSAKALHQASETQSTQVTYSHNTRYIQVNKAQ